MSVLILLLALGFALLTTVAMKREDNQDVTSGEADDKKPELAATKVKAPWTLRSWLAQLTSGVTKRSKASSKSVADGRQRWPWLEFVVGPGALQVTALLGGMLVASVSAEFAPTPEFLPTSGEVIEWTADLTNGINVRDLDLTKATSISVVVRAEPNDTAANVLFVETGGGSRTSHELKIVGGSSTSWRIEPSSPHLLVVTRAEGTKPAANVSLVVFMSRPGSAAPPR
jgi:hypothetical protein